jgi:hypothetical protein
LEHLPVHGAREELVTGHAEVIDLGPKALADVVEAVVPIELSDELLGIGRAATGRIEPRRGSTTTARRVAVLGSSDVRGGRLRSQATASVRPGPPFSRNAAPNVGATVRRAVRGGEFRITASAKARARPQVK